MKLSIICLVLVSMSLSTSQALYPVGERVVMIRIDDIQDYGMPSPYAEPEKTLLQYHLTKRIPALLSVIASRFGNDPQLTDQMREGLNQGIFTVGIHGWRHEPFTNLTLNAQISEMQRGKNRLEAIFGTEILCFIPPYNRFNQDTIEALKENGLTVMSSATYEGDIPRKEDGILFIPQTVTTAEVIPDTDAWRQRPLKSITEQIEDSWISYGVAVIVLHPRQFVGSDQEDRWNTYIEVLEWIQSNHGRIVRPEPPTYVKPYRFDSLLLSVGIFGGLTSALIIAFNVSSRRKNEKSQVVAE